MAPQDIETFNDWATETTQSSIKKTLEDNLKNYDAKKVEELLKKIEENTKALKGKGAGGSGGASGIDFTKAVKNLNLKEGGGTTGGGGGPTGGTASAAVISEGMKKAISSTPGGAGGGGGPIGEATEAKEEETAAVQKSSVGLLAFGRTISKSVIGVISLTAVMGALGKWVGSSIDGYRELMDSGQSFNGSLLEMRRQSADAGMGFESFTKIMGANSTIIKAVGNQSFIQLQKGVRNANKSFGQFGFTVDETAQYTADYLEQQIRSGRIDSLNREQQIKETQQYMFQVSGLAKITGQSRRQMMKDMKANAANVDIATAAAILGGKAGEQFREGLRKAGPAMTSMGSELNDALVDVAAKTVMFGNVGLSPLGRVASIVGGKMSTGIDGWVKALKRGESGNEHLADVFDALGDASGDSISTIAQLARAGDEGAKSMMGLITGFQKMGKEQRKELADRLGMTEEALEKDLKAQKEKLDAEQEMTNLAMNAQTAWRAALGKVENVLLKTFGPGLAELGKFVTENIGPMFEDLLAGAKPVIEALAVMGGAVFSVIKALSPALMVILGTLGAALIAYTAITWAAVAAKTVFTAMTAMASGALAIMASPIFLVVAAFAAIGLVIWAVTKYWHKIPELFGKMIDGIGEFLSEFGPKFLGWIKDGIAFLWDWSPHKLLYDFIKKMFDFDFSGMVDDLFSFDFWPFSKKKKEVKEPKNADDVVGVLDSISSLFSSDKEKTEAKISTEKKRDVITNIDQRKIAAATAATEAAKETTRQTGEEIAARRRAGETIDGGGNGGGTDVNDKILKQMEIANERAAAAQSAREEQVKETKKLSRSHNVGMSESR